MDYMRTVPIKAERGSANGRALLEGKIVHIPDVQAALDKLGKEAHAALTCSLCVGLPFSPLLSRY